MKTDKYILDEKGEPVPEPDLLKWAAWYEQGQKTAVHIVRNDTVAGARVSTGVSSHGS